MEKVLVLMSTYNGEKYLQDQIESILHQKNVDLHILVRDDGSNDSTNKILDEYAKNNQLSWYSGTNVGPARSFMDLLRKAPDYDYYAFSDQDDVWLDDKVCRGIKILREIEKDNSALYYGRPRLVDSSLNNLPNPKTSLHQMTTFRSSVVNSNATGCTFIFNKKLLDKVREKIPTYFRMHDYWLNEVCLATGGNVYFDTDVHILYRQHSNNVIGVTTSKAALIKKHFMSLNDKSCVRSRTISALYDCYKDQMNVEDKEIAYEISTYNKNIGNRFKLLLDGRIKTGYLLRDLLYKIAIITGAY